MMKDDDFLKLTPEEKNQLQLERLQSTLNRAYRNVPFHKNRFKNLGIDTSQIERVPDISRLPFMERKHFSENYPYDLFSVPLRDIVRIHTAPGTTLNPTVSGYTAQDLSAWQKILARGLAAAGVTPNDILQITLNPGLANWGRDYKSGAESLGVGVIPNTRLSVEKKLMVLRDYKTSVLITTPASAIHLLSHVIQKGINPDTLALKTLIIVGESLEGDSKKSLEESLGVTVWRHYGLSEVPGPAIAFECETHRGLHVNEDYFLPEIINPVSDKPLPDGEYGELVLTTLTTRAFPLIRFRTGDRARILKGGCSCGRSLKRMEWSGERTDNLINIDGVNVSSSQIRTNLQAMLDMEPASARFHVRQSDGEKYLEVWAPLDETVFSDEIKKLEALLKSAENRLSENLGIPVHIRLKEKSRL